MNSKSKRKSTESRNKFLKQFDWTDTLLTETEKQAIEDILVDYHDIFTRQRTDNGMNTEFRAKVTPKDDKAVYNQCLRIPILLKEDLNVELALMHKSSRRVSRAGGGGEETPCIKKG